MNFVRIPERKYITTKHINFILHRLTFTEAIKPMNNKAKFSNILFYGNSRKTYKA